MTTNKDMMQSICHRRPCKYVIWMPEVGLIITPNVTWLLPTKPVDTSTKIDYMWPQSLNNGNTYLAFYNSTIFNHGPLLGVLDISSKFLYNKTYKGASTAAEGQNNKLRYSISKDVKKEWDSLEKFLMLVADRLINWYPKDYKLPEIDFLEAPSSAGYLHYHASRNAAVCCALTTIDIFKKWCALISFGLTLWLQKFCKNCFDQAFTMLLQTTNRQLTIPWLRQLKALYICDMTFGMQAGGFFDVHTFHWGPWVDKMVAMSVPLWFQ